MTQVLRLVNSFLQLACMIVIVIIHAATYFHLCYKEMLLNGCSKLAGLLACFYYPCLTNNQQLRL